MDIFDTDKIFLFIAFVVPGFIAMKTYELLTPSRYIDSSKQIIDAITYSCINYSILLFPIYYLETSDLKHSSKNGYVLCWSLILFLAPVLWVYLWKVIRHSEWAQKFIPHPVQKPWDFVFSKRKCYWVIITLKDNNKIAGKFCENSFASSAPAEEQIYIEQEWILNEDGGFEREANGSCGILVLSSEIRSVEFYEF